MVFFISGFFSFLLLNSPVLWKAEDSESGSKDDVRGEIYKGESEGIKPKQNRKNTEKRGNDAGLSHGSAALVAAAWGCFSICFHMHNEAQNTEVKDSKVAKCC